MHIVNTSCMHIQMFMSPISLKKTLPLVYVSNFAYCLFTYMIIQSSYCPLRALSLYINWFDLIYVCVLNIFCFQGVDQILSDLSLWEHINMNNIRQRFSELRRINAYGLELYQYSDLPESERLYFTSLKHKKKRLSYIRTSQNMKFKWSDFFRAVKKWKYAVLAFWSQNYSKRVSVLDSWPSRQKFIYR